MVCCLLLRLTEVLFQGQKWKLCDFGLTSEVPDDPNEPRWTSRVRGTDVYAAPELAYHKRFYKSLDIWSLGCILYEVAFEHPPFSHGPAYSPVWDAFRDGTSPDPLGFKSLPDGLYFEPYIMQMLQVNELNRPTVTQLLAQFVEARDKLDTARYVTQGLIANGSMLGTPQ